MDKMLTVTRDNTRHKREGIITLFQDRTLNYRTNSSSFAGHAGSCLTHTHTNNHTQHHTKTTHRHTHTHTHKQTHTHRHTHTHAHTHTNTHTHTHTQWYTEQEQTEITQTNRDN